MTGLREKEIWQVKYIGIRGTSEGKRVARVRITADSPCKVQKKRNWATPTTAQKPLKTEEHELGERCHESDLIAQNWGV